MKLFDQGRDTALLVVEALVGERELGRNSSVNRLGERRMLYLNHLCQDPYLAGDLFNSPVVKTIEAIRDILAQRAQQRLNEAWHFRP